MHSYFLRTSTIICFVPTSDKFDKSIFEGPNGTLVEIKILTLKSYMMRPLTNLTIVETKRITVEIGKIIYGAGSPKFIWAPVYSCTHWLRPRNSPPPPAFGLLYECAIGEPR